MNDAFVEPKPWTHQSQAVEMSLKQNSFGFLFDAGTGKTLACILSLRRRYEKHGSLMSTLILAPVIVLENWVDEIAKFSRIPLQKVVVLSGSTEKRRKTLAEYRKKYDNNFIALTNYEILSTSRGMVTDILAWGPTCLVIDESQKIKSIGSERTKKVISIADRATYKYIMTGTPVLNTPMDIFSQWRALDGGEAFGKNIFIFRNKYFYDKNANMPRQNYFPNWVIRPDSYAEIKRLISLNSLRAKKEDCLDLPPLVRVRHNVEMGPDQTRHYNNMKNHFISYLENSAIVVEIVLTKLMRMLQITTGFMKDDNDVIWPFKDNPRERALKDLLEGIIPAHKVIVWCVFKENYTTVADVCKKLGVKYVECHGGISNKDKYINVDLFNNDPDTRVFIGHPASLGIGINLCSASYSIVYSRSWSLEADLQSEARNYRAGSEIHKTITKIDLIAGNTIDAGIFNCLESKLTDANKIVGFMKSYLKKDVLCQQELD